MPESQATAPAPAARRARLIASLQEIVNELTGLPREQIDPQAGYLEAGVDSLLLIQLSQAIQNRFAVKLSLIQLLEELTTLDAVASFLDERLPADAVPEAATAITRSAVTTTSPLVPKAALPSTMPAA